MNSNKVIWITGASSGIGRALALNYAQNYPDDRVVVSSRSRASLEETFKNNPNVFCYAADVTDQTSMQQVASTIEQNFGRLDIVFVNAGICEYIDNYPVDMASVDRVFDTNVKGAIHSVNVALPLLERVSNPRIVAVGSQVVFAPFPRAGLYAASKIAMTAFFEALRLDVKRQNIAVSIVYPGFVDTPASPDKSFPRPFLLSPEDAASRIIDGVNRGRRDIIFPKRLYWLLKLKYLTKLWEFIVLPEDTKK
jgi:NAD(P)-dependent dehydrogenase (short-subunit alcohol dehydrogenase family)